VYVLSGIEVTPYFSPRVYNSHQSPQVTDHPRQSKSYVFYLHKKRLVCIYFLATFETTMNNAPGNAQATPERIGTNTVSPTGSDDALMLPQYVPMPVNGWEAFSYALGGQGDDEDEDCCCPKIHRPETEPSFPFLEPNEPSLQRSKSIPVKNGGGMRRTLSEEQLHDEERMADFRDYVMFNRIVNGIAKTQHKTLSYSTKQSNDMCLANIIGVRNLSEEQLKDITSHRTQAPQAHLSHGAAYLPKNEARGNLRQYLEESCEHLNEDPMFDLEL